MQLTSEIIADLIKSANEAINNNANEILTLDQVLGDGDHLTNLQRGLAALLEGMDEIIVLDWKQALQKTGMTLLSTMGGASGSLLGTLFISMSKLCPEEGKMNLPLFADIFSQGVESVKKRGKSDSGEKTMLDVLIPVSKLITSAAKNSQGADEVLLDDIIQTAHNGMLATRDMLATKGRASYLQEKSIGHIDAGARTTEIMICAISKVLQKK